jgi:hypothetical protein
MKLFVQDLLLFVQDLQVFVQDWSLLPLVFQAGITFNAFISSRLEIHVVAMR